MTCPEMNKSLVDLFLESRPLSEEAKKHAAECSACAGELAGMERTWKLLDEWQAPEPSAFFDAKLYARLRQEKESAPAGFFERAKTWLLYNTNVQLRPVAAGALATVIAVGGEPSLCSTTKLALLRRPPPRCGICSLMMETLNCFNN